MAKHRPLLQPERLRNVEPPFGWVPCRLLSDGLLTKMAPATRQLYLFLVLAADRRGVSFYGMRRCQQILQLSESDLRKAHRELVGMDLLASDGRTHQLLSLPTQTTRHETFTANEETPASRSQAVSTQPRRALHDDQFRSTMPDHIREALSAIFGGAE